MDIIGIIYNLEKYIRKYSISLINMMMKNFSSFNYSKEARKNKKLKNIYKGKRCFILGNGPSLRDEDLSGLKNEIVFTVNGFMRAKELYDQVEPNYHFLFDPLYFKEETTDYIMHDLKTIKETLSNGKNKPVIVMPYGSKTKINIKKYTDVIYINDKLVFSSAVKEYDISKSVERCSAVVHYAICFATYLGIKEIYLLGVEQTDILGLLNNLLNIDEGIYVYEENKKDIESRKKLIIKEQHNLEKQLNSYARIFGDYIKLYERYKKMGISIYNCTDKSLVEVIPHVNLRAVLGENEII